MDETDRKILNIIQTDFPVVAEPFKILGEKVGISDDEALERIRKLKKDGIIRRIGAVFDNGKLGFTSTLCAARVPEKKIKEFVDIVNSYPGVTHNYKRNHEYNVWFTFIAPAEVEIEKSLKEISDKTGVSDIFNIPAKRKFKIDASFEL
ncbi:MAG: AsnC family transcriptional regulator [Syntrophobacterales bacterium]|nr:AsnC family transcriptional regulator [Syntrophobacterales bacterium]